MESAWKNLRRKWETTWTRLLIPSFSRAKTSKISLCSIWTSVWILLFRNRAFWTRRWRKDWSKWFILRTWLNQQGIKPLLGTRLIRNSLSTFLSINPNARFLIYRNFSLIFNQFLTCLCKLMARTFLTNTEWNIITGNRSSSKRINSFSKHLSVKWFLQLTLFPTRKKMLSKFLSLIRILRKRNRSKVLWRDK